MKIGFNNKFMYDALRASESDTVLIEINEPIFADEGNANGRGQFPVPRYADPSVRRME